MTETAASFDDFFERTHRNVFRAVLLVTRDRAAAEDAVGNAYLRALEDWQRVSCHPHPVAWVTRVAINDSISAWRRLRLQIPLATGHSLSTEIPEPQEDLLKALSQLPLRQRQVVALRILVGLDTAETAEALSMAPGTVTAHLHRALRSLRARLDKR